MAFDASSWTGSPSMMNAEAAAAAMGEFSPAGAEKRRLRYEGFGELEKLALLVRARQMLALARVLRLECGAGDALEMPSWSHKLLTAFDTAHPPVATADVLARAKAEREAEVQALRDEGTALFKHKTPRSILGAAKAYGAAAASCGFWMDATKSAIVSNRAECWLKLADPEDDGRRLLSYGEKALADARQALALDGANAKAASRKARAVAKLFKFLCGFESLLQGGGVFGCRIRYDHYLDLLKFWVEMASETAAGKRDLLMSQLVDANGLTGGTCAHVCMLLATGTGASADFDDVRLVKLQTLRWIVETAGPEILRTEDAEGFTPALIACSTAHDPTEALEFIVAAAGAEVLQKRAVRSSVIAQALGQSEEERQAEVERNLEGQHARAAQAQSVGQDMQPMTYEEMAQMIADSRKIYEDNEYGRSCALLAAEEGNLGCLKLIVRHLGLESLDSPCTYEDPQARILRPEIKPAQAAAKRGRVDVLRYIIRNLGAACLTDSADATNRTAAHQACFDGHPGVLELIAEVAGLDALRVKNAYGDTPLDILEKAEEQGRTPSVACLERMQELLDVPAELPLALVARQRLALAKAGSVRLGAASPFAHLEEGELLQTVAEMGDGLLKANGPGVTPRASFRLIAKDRAAREPEVLLLKEEGNALFREAKKKADFWERTAADYRSGLEYKASEELAQELEAEVTAAEHTTLAMMLAAAQRYTQAAVACNYSRSVKSVLLSNRALVYLTVADIVPKGRGLEIEPVVVPQCECGVAAFCSLDGLAGAARFYCAASPGKVHGAPSCSFRCEKPADAQSENRRELLLKALRDAADAQHLDVKNSKAAKRLALAKKRLTISGLQLEHELHIGRAYHMDNKPIAVQAGSVGHGQQKCDWRDSAFVPPTPTVYFSRCKLTTLTLDTRAVAECVECDMKGVYVHGGAFVGERCHIGAEGVQIDCINEDTYGATSVLDRCELKGTHRSADRREFCQDNGVDNMGSTVLMFGGSVTGFFRAVMCNHDGMVEMRGRRDEYTQVLGESGRHFCRRMGGEFYFESGEPDGIAPDGVPWVTDYPD